MSPRRRAVDRILVAAVVAGGVGVLVAHPWTPPVIPVQIAYTAESNLQTALVAVNSYYRDNGSSLGGLLTPGGSVPDLQQQLTGLQYIGAGRATRSPHVISVFLPALGGARGAGGAVIMTTYSAARSTCFGVVEVATDPRHSPVLARFPETGEPGTWYFSVANRPSCAASTIGREVVALSRTDFPGD